MKSFFVITLFFLNCISTESYSQGISLSQEIINSTSLDSLKKYVKILSGDTVVTINNSQSSIYSRFVGQPGNELAQSFLINELKSYGLEVFVQNVDPIVQNIYAVQTGKDNSKVVIISAHYDDCGNKYNCDKDSMSYSPGADDNASGVAATLECARLISKYYTKYKIVYAFWDSEEQGLIGSGYYAAFSKENILGVINLDMIGWDSNDDGLIEIHDRDTTILGFIDLPSIIIEVNDNYNIGLQPIVYKPGTWRSDHYRFWLNNINAILLIEGLYSGDFNEYYHSKDDKFERLNLNYFHKASKLAIGSIATLAEILDRKINIPSDYYISQNYPNPFNSETIINYSIPIDNYVSIKIYNILGQLVETLVSRFHNAGSYSIIYNSNNLSSGVYFYTIQSSDFHESKKMILLK